MLFISIWLNIATALELSPVYDKRHLRSRLYFPPCRYHRVYEMGIARVLRDPAYLYKGEIKEIS
jgi:hypothetical protein